MNIIGNARNNVLIDSAGLFDQSDDFIFAGKGNDHIIDLAGQDRIYAGQGNDNVEIFGNRGVFASGGKGYDVLTIHVANGDGSGWWNDPQDPHHPPEILAHYKGFEEVHFDFS